MSAAARQWVWLGLLWAGLMSGLWAGLSHGYGGAVFAMFACWLLGVAWLVASARAER